VVARTLSWLLRSWPGAASALQVPDVARDFVLYGTLPRKDALEPEVGPGMLPCMTLFHFV
jgi:hypothetical protein